MSLILAQLPVSEWGTLEWLGAAVAVLTLIGGIVSFAGGIWWCSSTYSMLKTIRDEVTKTNGRVNNHDQLIADHRSRLDKIETSLDLES